MRRFDCPSNVVAGQADVFLRSPLVTHELIEVADVFANGPAALCGVAFLCRVNNAFLPQRRRPLPLGGDLTRRVQVAADGFLLPLAVVVKPGNDPAGRFNNHGRAIFRQRGTLPPSVLIMPHGESLHHFFKLGVVLQFFGRWQPLSFDDFRAVGDRPPPRSLVNTRHHVTCLCLSSASQFPARGIRQVDPSRYKKRHALDSENGRVPTCRSPCLGQAPPVCGRIGPSPPAVVPSAWFYFSSALFYSGVVVMSTPQDAFLQPICQRGVTGGCIVFALYSR